VGSVVELSVSLCSDSGRLVPGIDVPFQVVMKRKDDPTSPAFNGSIQILNPEALRVCGSTGAAPPVRVLLVQCSEYSNMVLTINPTDSSQTNVASSSTNPFQVVRSRLEIFNESEIKKSWYKDEGGKDNQIELDVRLVNSSMETDVTRTSMKLRCFLRYENGEDAKEAEKRPKKKSSNSKKTPPKKEDPLFTVSNDTNLYLDDKGRCRIKCRIGQVSSNHGQNFQIWVAPDFYQSSILNQDVSPAHTPAITVKSKISKRNREERNLPPPAGSKRSKATDKATPDVQRISPVNVAKSHEGVDVNALLEFSSSVVVSLQRLKEEHELLKMQQRLGQSAPGNISVDAMPTVYELLDMHNQLRLPPPPSPSLSQSESNEPMSEGEEDDDDDGDGDGDVNDCQLISNIAASGVPMTPCTGVERQTGKKDDFAVATPPKFQFAQAMQPMKSVVPVSVPLQVPMNSVYTAKSAFPMQQPLHAAQQSFAAFIHPRGELRCPEEKREPSLFSQQAHHIATFGQGSIGQIGVPVGTAPLGPDALREISCGSIEDLESVDITKYFA
jgi:hypothetical protein